MHSVSISTLYHLDSDAQLDSMYLELHTLLDGKADLSLGHPRGPVPRVSRDIAARRREWGANHIMKRQARRYGD